MLRQTVRTLFRARGVTVIAILALALGIGANTAVFSVVNAVFLRPLPYPQADRLVNISETSGGQEWSVSYLNFRDWQQQAHSVEAIAAVVDSEETLESRAPLERLPITYVSAEFFPILRTQPVLGRGFRPEDDRANAAPVTILSHEIWKSHYGGDPAIVGQTVRIDQRPYTVIGVLAPGFRFYRPARVFAPISDVVTRKFLNMRENHNNLSAIARLKPGVTVAQANAEMAAIAAGLARAYPGSNAGLSARADLLRDRISGSARKPVMILLAAVSMVLLIACVNVANLLLARASERRKEMALRTALGASRWHVLRQLLLESVLLSLAGGVLGVLLSSWSFAALARLIPESLNAGGIGIDFRVLGYTLLISLATGVLFGLAPAFETWRVNLTDAMRDGGRTSSGVPAGRLRDALVVAEVSLALVLLVGAGLLLRTLYELTRVPLGFTSEQVLTARISLPDSAAYPYGRTNTLFETMVERVGSLPGVRAAGTTDHLPLGNMFSSMQWYRDDRPVPERSKLPSVENRTVSPGYFAAMGIPLLRGRLFTAADGRLTGFRPEKLLEWARANRFAVLISESMAKRYWPGEDPIGKSFRPGTPEMGLQPVKIVGVVGDVRDYGPQSEMLPTFYWSAYHLPERAATMVVRVRSGDPSSLIPALRRTVTEVDSGAAITAVTTAESIVTESVAPQRLHMQLLSVFAMLALVLASVGIYGVMAYTVSRRAHEIGVRMALGAGQANVIGMVLRKAALLAGVGVALGSAAAFGLTRLIEGMLFGVKPADPLTFASVAVLLFGVTVAASSVPARRAANVSPLTALRSE